MRVPESVRRRRATTKQLAVKSHEPAPEPTREPIDQLTASRRSGSGTSPVRSVARFPGEHPEIPVAGDGAECGTVNVPVTNALRVIRTWREAAVGSAVPPSPAGAVSGFGDELDAERARSIEERLATDMLGKKRRHCSVLAAGSTEGEHGNSRLPQGLGEIQSKAVECFLAIDLHPPPIRGHSYAVQAAAHLPVDTDGPWSLTAIGRSIIANLGDVLLRSHADRVRVGLQCHPRGTEILQNLGERSHRLVAEVDSSPDRVETATTVGNILWHRANVPICAYREDAARAGVALLRHTPAVLTARRHEIEPGSRTDTGACRGAHAAGDPSMKARAAPTTSALLRSRTAVTGVASPRRGLDPTSQARATSGPSSCDRRCHTR